MKEIGKLKNDKFEEFIKTRFYKKREENIKTISEESFIKLEKNIFIQILDLLWRSHLQYLDQLRSVIGLRSYGQKDPLDEFKKEAFKLFEGLISKLKIDVINFLANLKLELSTEIIKPKSKNKENIISKSAKIPRNSRCPCGSGKKYKHCCGKI